MDYQFIIRSNAHVASLMSANLELSKKLVDYKRELCSIFALIKIKLVFVEYYLPPPSPMKEKKHFDILAFGIPENDFNGLREYFCRAIKSLKGEEDANQNTLIFKDLDHFRRIQKDVSAHSFSSLFEQYPIDTILTSLFFPLNPLGP